MSDQPKNLEEIPQGGSHVLDITFLTSANGTPTNPDGYSPPDDPTPQVTPAWYIYDEGNETYNAASGGYNAPSVADLRYGGSTGRFLITPVAQVDTTLSSDLVGEKWAIGWTTTINGKTRTFFEFVTIVESGAASFGSGGYCDLDSVREDVGQLTKDEVYTIAAEGNAVAGSITFTDNETKAIVSITVNGAELTSGWAFVKPNKVTFSPALTEDDVVEITRDTCMTDTQVNKQIVAVSRYIDGQLTKVYDVPFTSPYPPLIDALCMKLSSAEIRMKLFDSTDRDGDHRGREQWKRWHLKLEELRDEVVALVDDNGDVIDTIGGGGVFISNEDVEPLFTMDDIPDVGHVSSRTGWEDRRRGF